MLQLQNSIWKWDWINLNLNKIFITPMCGHQMEVSLLNQLIMLSISKQYEKFGEKDFSAGMFVESDSVVGAKIVFDCSFSVGGFFSSSSADENSKTKSYSLDVGVETERRIHLVVANEQEKLEYKKDIGEIAYDKNGMPILRPGKVNAYRFMTFFKQPAIANTDFFFNTVVDRIWLNQSNSANAAALRSADRGVSTYRIYHRVTFVSRILPPYTKPNTPPLEAAIKAANINSNYELVRMLDPYLSKYTTDYTTFQKELVNVLKKYPPLLQNQQEILTFFLSYYNITVK